MKKLRLLLVAPIPPPYGGIGNWTFLLKKYINKRKDIELVDILNTAPKQRSLDGRSFFQRTVGQGIEMLRSAKRLKKITKEKQPDVVHITTSGQLAIIRDIRFLKICKAKKIQTVYHIRFGRANKIAKANTFEWKLFKKAIKLSTVTMAIDETTEQTLKQFFPEKIVRIANPFDLSTIDDIDNSKAQKEIMFLGWCIKTKGIEELLEAWSDIVVKHSEWKLRIVGPCQDFYRKELEKRYSFKNVIFDGEKAHDEAMKLLSETGIFILPSYTEGFPNVILEAMALRKPIIATDVGAIKEMLSEESGMIIPSQNTYAIKDALCNLIENEQLREKLAKNAYTRVRSEYSIDSIFEKYKAVWSGVQDDHI